MATKLNVYNLAFAHLGEPVVTTLTDDPVTPNVAKANALWDQLLEEAQARAPWLCVLEGHTLSADVAPPEGWTDPKYDYRFTCPLGTLRIWTVDLPLDVAWQKGAAVDDNGAARVVIKAVDAGPLDVEIGRRRPIEAMTPLLVKAIALDLAAMLAGPIQQNEQKAQALHKRAAEAYLIAEGAEANEIGGQERMIGDGPMTLGRLSAL
jgi:hypothetical protein